MLIAPVLLRTDSVVVTTTALFLAIASLASSTLWDGVPHKLRHGGAGVDSGGSQVLGSVFDKQQPAPRQILADLLHDCAAHNISDEDTVETFDSTTTLSLGTGVARILTGQKRAGGEEGTWYEDQLASLLVEFCEEEQRGVHHRYVYILLCVCQLFLPHYQASLGGACGRWGSGSMKRVSIACRGGDSTPQDQPIHLSVHLSSRPSTPPPTPHHPPLINGLDTAIYVIGDTPLTPTSLYLRLCSGRATQTRS